MRFEDGREALEWFVENKDNVRTAMPNTMDARIMNDGGIGLQYDSNTVVGEPGWADVVDAIIDIERIMKRHLKPDEARALLYWAFYGFTSDKSEEEIEDDREYGSLATEAQKKRFYRAMKRFEEKLGAFGYLKNVKKNLH